MMDLKVKAKKTTALVMVWVSIIMLTTFSTLLYIQDGWDPKFIFLIPIICIAWVVGILIIWDYQGKWMVKE